MKLNDVVIKECYEIMNKDSKKLTWKELAVKHNFSDGESLRQKFKAYRKKNGDLPSIDEMVLAKYGVTDNNKSKPYKESIQMNENGTQVSDKKIEVEDEGKLKDPDYMLEKHGFDKSKWQIERCKNTFWDTQLKGGKVVKLYASKLSLKPRTERVWTKDKLKELSNYLYSLPRRTINVNTKVNDSEDLLLVRLSDFHYNLKSDLLTTGNEYNVKVAEECFNYVIDKVHRMYKGMNIDKVLFTIGDDFINADNIQGTTTKGTPQDNDVSWEKAVLGATRIIRDSIELLCEIAPVDVLNIQSNHDQHTMFGIAETLKARYEDLSYINVINNPVPNNYYIHGKNLMCMAHDINVKKALEIISDQAKKYWSDCNNVMCILGHLHSEMQYQKQGRLQVMRMPTISGWSRWANGKGYSQSDRRADICVINAFEGITDKSIIHIK